MLSAPPGVERAAETWFGVARFHAFPVYSFQYSADFSTQFAVRTSAAASAAGSGGGGAGESIVLISGADISLANSEITAAGGVGGERPNIGTTKTCNVCNAGGNGGKGYIFMMDPDGEIDGHIPSAPGRYPSRDEGITNIQIFDGARFSSITAVTELFGVRAADPAYKELVDTAISAVLNDNQTIELVASSARADIDNPLAPNISTELDPAEMIALITKSGPRIVVDTSVGSLTALNQGAVPDREAFVRIRAKFVYGDPTEAALGPFAMMNSVRILFTFNG